jgi:carbonic anhydrase
MRLFEAIIEQNNRAVAGDKSAGLHPSEFLAELPIVALTCIDARLNPLFPEVLGVAKEQFIWLRNAGNIITGPLSSTMRSLALACAVKGGREIAIIGHSDCLVCKTGTMNLTDAFTRLGINRAALPENLTEFFGLFASERANVIKGVEFTRHSPLIGPKVPVHGLMVDITTGKLEWVVNGYETLAIPRTRVPAPGELAAEATEAFKSLAEFKLGEMKFPETQIGQIEKGAVQFLQREVQQIGSQPAQSAPPPMPPKPPSILPPRRTESQKIPVPPRIRPDLRFPKR